MEEEDFRLLVKLHQHSDRQGPGGLQETSRAIDLAGLHSIDRRLKIADIGCGSGASALVLAEALNAEITAVDLFPEFLEVLSERASAAGLQDKIKTKACSMDSLSFQSEEFDVIWSEGAIYNIGFQNGVKQWSKFIKKGGVLAVSEITWLTQNCPEEIQKFWSSEYPEIATASEKIKILEECGYRILGYFPLPASCWTKNYYEPLQGRYADFLKSENNSGAAKQVVQMAEAEFELYEKFCDYYSYGFYIAERL